MHHGNQEQTCKKSFLIAPMVGHVGDAELPSRVLINRTIPTETRKKADA